MLEPAWRSRATAKAIGAATKLGSAPILVSARATPLGNAAVAKNSDTVNPMDATIPTITTSPKRSFLAVVHPRDVLLSVKRVGPTGKAYGLDMTDETLALAREKRRDQASRMSPAALRRSMELWGGCVSGALEESTYRSKLSGAGFEAVDLEPTRIYRAADAKQFLQEAGLSDDATIAQVDGRIMSAFVRARKPAARGREALLRANLLFANDGEFENRPARP